MDTDGPLKLLFRKYAPDLLPLMGDGGATVLDAGPVELQALKRRVDCVVHLRRDGEIYYRHVEFQSEVDPDMPTRGFRYNTQLLLQYDAPVITTVIYLGPPKPKREAVFRVSLGGHEINRWSFEELCLWEIDAHAVLAQGAPGLLALVPLMAGGRSIALLKDAISRVESAFPEQRLSDAEDVLLALAGRYYTVSELARIVGRDRMIQSSLYVEGEAQGRINGERELCAALARKHHPTVFERARTAIDRCDDPQRLKDWALAASDLSDEDFLKLLNAPG